MSTHYAIFVPVAHHSKQSAVLEVGADLPGTVEFAIFPSRSAPICFQLGMNGANFVSSASHTTPNLLALTGYRGAIVKAEMLGGQTCAVLRQATHKESKILLNVPPFERARGKRFGVAVGAPDARLLVANPSGLAMTIDVRLGSTSNIPTPHQVPAYDYIELTDLPVGSFVSVTGVADFFVQLMTDGSSDATFLLPL